MSGRINSQPIGVKTIYEPLDAAFDITVTGSNSGVGLSQWYISSKVLTPQETDDDKYDPNRKRYPVTLHPVVTAIDTETHAAVSPVIQGVSWTEITGSGTRTLITNTSDTSSADYVVLTDGSLKVKKNIPYNEQVSIECVVTWTDPRNGEWHKDSKSLNLKTNLAATEVWDVHIVESSQKWNPLSGMSSTFTVTAKAMLGGTDMSDDSDVTFVWKYIHNNTEVAVDDSEDPCLAYVSGQGTKTITIDAEYETEKLTLVCYIGTGNPVTVMTNIRAYANIVWSIPRSEGMAFSPNGDTARQTIPTMTFQTMVQSGGAQVAENILRSRTRTHWTAKRDSNGATRMDLGWGFEATMKRSDLLASDGSRMVVTPEIHVLSPYKVITQNFSGTDKVLYYMDGSTQRFIISKVID